MEIEHLKIAVELMKQIDGKDPAETLLPPAIPEVVTFEPNKQFVRQVLATQVDLRPDGTDFVPESALPRDHRFFRYQATVNDDFIPSEDVIEEHLAISGEDYRLETDGPNPVIPEQRKRA